ncbi:hypothetical protein SEPCBS119000_006782, partial [Sporothrix epigloea]
MEAKETSDLMAMLLEMRQEQQAMRQAQQAERAEAPEQRRLDNARMHHLYEQIEGMRAGQWQATEAAAAAAAAADTATAAPAIPAVGPPGIPDWAPRRRPMIPELAEFNGDRQAYPAWRQLLTNKLELDGPSVTLGSAKSEAVEDKN